jgi:hypothetical protein
MWRDDPSLTIGANPFAIGQFTSGGIPSGAFTFEFSRDLVEGERLRLENAACECDFLDFHASPFALQIASDASEIKAHIGPSGSYCSASITARFISPSNAESKSGAAAIRRAVEGSNVFA